MPGDDPDRSCTLQPDCMNIIGVPDRKRFGACNPGVGRPSGQRDSKHGIFDARTQSRDEGQREDQSWKGKEDVGDPHQHNVNPAARIAGDRSHDQAHHRRHHRHQNDDVDGDSCSIEDARIDIAPEAVGSEDVPLFRRAPANGLARSWAKGSWVASSGAKNRPQR